MRRWVVPPLLSRRDTPVPQEISNLDPWLILRNSKVQTIIKSYKWFRHQTRHMTWQWLVACAVIAIPFAILVDASVQNANVAEAMNVDEIEVEPKVVQLVVVTDWTPERIEQEIRTVFPEAPNTAVAIAKCESGLDPDIQSYHILSYGREQSFGIFQIHAKDHDRTAKRLGYDDYKTDVRDNLAMARYLYDNRGNFRDWTCYNTGQYKRYL